MLLYTLLMVFILLVFRLRKGQLAGVVSVFVIAFAIISIVVSITVVSKVIRASQIQL